MQQSEQQATMQTDTPPRYDQEAVRQILARASTLEQEEQERLSATQVEALGAELGISPEAVRRALQEREGISRATESLLPRSSLPPLTMKRIGTACMPGFYIAAAMSTAFFGLATIYPHGLPEALGFFILFSVVVLPLIIALWSARRLQDWRLGLISSVTSTIFLFVGIGIGVTLATPNSAPPDPSLWISAFFILALCALVGVWGGAMQRRTTVSPRPSGRATDR